ncbi:type II toxin-antitoxin system RelE/ParE family toxin [Parabacteroides sp.]
MVIIWGNQAKQTLHEIITYYKENVSYNTAQSIKKLIMGRIRQLQIFPYSGPIEISDGNIAIRYLVISHYKVYYYVDQDRIHIILVWDTRQDSDKLWHILRYI